MKFKTSWYNPVITTHQLKRYWPLPALMMVWCLIAYVMDLHNSMSYLRSTPGDLGGSLEGVLTTAIILLIPAAFLSAKLCFHYLHGRTAAQFYLSLPMKRRCSYISVAVSGWLMAAIPLLVTIALLMLVTLGLPGAVVILLRVLVFGLSTWTIYYAMAVLSCILAGNLWGSGCLYAGMHCGLLLLIMGAKHIAGWFVLGMSNNPDYGIVLQWLTPAVNLLNVANASNGFPIRPAVIYLVVGLVLLAAGCLLYERRNNENTGETIAFRFLRPVCKVFGALLVALLGSLLLKEYLWVNEGLTVPVIALMLLVLTAIGWAVAEMIVERTLRIFGRGKLLAPAMLMLVVLAAIVVGSCYRPSVPAASDIDQAALVINHTSMDITPEDAEALLRVINENSDELLSSTASVSHPELTVVYGLKNGKIVQRYYSLKPDAGSAVQEDYYNEAPPKGNIADEVVRLLHTPEICLQSYFVNWLELPSAERCQYAAVVFNQSDTPEKELSAREAQQVYEAFCQDVEAGSVNPAVWYGGSWTCPATIQLNYYSESYNQEKFGNYDNYMEKVYYDSAALPVTEDMTRTLAVLAELGITLAYGTSD